MYDLFQPVEAKEIQLRDYQAQAVEALREGIRKKLRRQILCATTGAGKTLTSAHMLHEAAAKGSYTLFIVDRLALIDQTSAVFDEYGIPHGVVQGDHPRWQPHENVQVCSAQTLARRRLPRSPALIIVDECHAQYKATLDYIEANPQAVVIGLTATPFTKGMGQNWDGIVNVVPTRQLIDAGHLIEPTIYVAKSPEDAALGLNSYGEFSDESATSAGIEIVGDVVQEWITKTHEHFGGPVKTIVFSPTVEHGRELCAAFAAAGYNFQQVSYMDRSDEERREKIEEFRRPDSIINGLVSCGVLTRGFDVPEVRIGISCKPYRKSLSGHMQEMGRVMRTHAESGKDKALWLCLARDSKVLTDRGLIKIQFVTRYDKVWDGENFVSHGGVICKGVQNVITYQGLTATPGHLVHTVDGWRTFGDCAREQITITQTGFGREAIRIGGNNFARRALAWAKATAMDSCRLRVRDLWLSVCRIAFQFGERSNKRLPHLQPACAGISDVAIPESSGAKASLHKSEQPYVECLRRAWDQIQFRGSEGRNPLDNGKSRDTRELQALHFGQDRPRRTLRAGQHSLAPSATGFDEQTGQPGGRKAAQVSDRASRNSICRRDYQALSLAGDDFSGDSREVSPEVGQTQREVWDILDAGPHNRFTCEGLLVHNCHSGNVERFALDVFEVWENGVGDLDKSTQRDAKPRERNAETREKVVCPECSGALRGNTCLACGWEKPARSGIVNVEGEMQAFDMAAAAMQPRAGLRADCLKEPRRVWEAALRYTMASTRKGEEHARKWAYGVFRGVYPNNKLPSGWFHTPVNPALDPHADSLVEREIKRFRKNSRRAA